MPLSYHVWSVYQAAEGIGVQGRVFVTKISMVGAHVVKFTDENPEPGMQYVSYKHILTCCPCH